MYYIDYYEQLTRERERGENSHMLLYAQQKSIGE